MPSIQPRIPYNIRKKLTSSSASKATNISSKKNNLEIKARSRSIETNIKSPQQCLKKMSPLGDLRTLSKENTPIKESDQPRRLDQHKTLFTSPRCTKRLFLDASDDEDEAPSPSPPKQEKKNIGKSSPQTPTQLISRLHIKSSPSSSALTEKSQSPKKGLIYQNVRQALHSAVPEYMPGREKELNDLSNFLRIHLEAKSSATLYVSGPPGTGKTACLSKTVLLPEFKDGFKTVYVNCTTMKSAVSIYGRIVEELGLKPDGKSSKDYLPCIEKYLGTNKKMILLVLDEIDQLDSKNQSVLYTIFEWPSKVASKLVLVGIANALDLTDRILPRLQARLELKPKLMHFPPYSKEQIINILSERLTSSDPSHVFTPVAVQLVAAKVASVSGDARRALDIARRVVEMADNRVMPLKPTTDHASNSCSPKKSDGSSVKLQEVLTVLNTVYGASQSLDEDCDDSFPLQQKVLLCTLALIVAKGTIKDITVGKLHEIYRRVCSRQKLPSLCQSEFLSLCGLVETRGIISVQPRKEARLSKVCLQWDAEEVSAVLKDKQLLADIMKDTSCLTK